MVQLTPTSQRGFVKGLIASTSRMAQPKASVPRASNLLFTRRGSLTTIDGTSTVANSSTLPNNTGFYTIGTFVDTHLQQLSQPALCGLTQIGTAISQPPTPTLAAANTSSATIAASPTGAVRIGEIATYTLTAAPTINYQVGQIVSISGVADGTFNVVAPIIAVGPLVDASGNPLQFSVSIFNLSDARSGGGTVATGALVPTTQYFYKLVAVDASGAVFQTAFPPIDGVAVGSSLPSAEASFTETGGNNAIKLTWTAQREAAGYLVYRSTTTNTEVLVSGYIPNSSPEATITWYDLGQAGNNTTPPVSNTSRTSVFFAITGLAASNYGASQIAATFPWANYTRAATPPYGWYDGTGGAFSDAWSPFGGTVGTTSGIPQFVPIVGQLVLCLGNSYPPYIYNGTTIKQVTSTFATSLPIWVASTFFALGQLIVPSPGNNFYYKCIQAGTTGASAPTFPTTPASATVASGAAIFQLVGPTTSGASSLAAPPPPGAAHGTNYAGFLWVANTNPFNSLNGLDGPSALRMSDLNNPTSWNPVNAAFIGKDDGTQITGLAQFTIAEAGIIPTGSLVVFKEYSTYQITGVFGASNFAIQQAQTDLGCVAPRSIQFIPGFGIMRLTHLGWAVFDGVRDRLLSEELRPYIYSDTSIADITAMDWGYAWKVQGTQTAAPPMYVASYANNSNGHLGDAVAFDLVLRAWTHITWPSETRTLYQLTSLPFPAVTYVTDTFGNILRWQAGDEQFVVFTTPTAFTSQNVNWSVRTPEVLGRNVTDRFYPRRLLVRGTNKATGTNFTVPTTSVQFNRTNETAFASTVRNLPAGAGGTEFELDVGITPHISTSLNALISGSGRVELDAFEWFVQPKSTGVPITIT